jgi:probable O-glycosylation ligase (exosortase A-associated)
MRSLIFMAAMGGLLPLAMLRPFAGVLLWSWISFMNPHRLVWGMAADQPWAMAVFAATVIGCVIAREQPWPRPNTNTILIILFMVCISLTSLAALAPPEDVFDKWNRTIKVLFFLLITASLLKTRERVHALVWVMVISLAYFGVRGGAFAITTGGNYRVYGPAETMISDNNHLAAALLVALPLMNYLRLQSCRRSVRLALAVGMALTVLAVVASYSRGALLGLGAVTACFWVSSRHKVSMAIVLAVVLAAAISFMPSGWMDRMHSIQTYQQDESAETRLTMWQTSLTMALERFTGSGFLGPYEQEVVDQFVPGAPARAVHSIYFEVLGEHGFAVFFVWLSFAIVGLLSTLRINRLVRHRPDLAWAGDLARMSRVSLIGYLVAGTFLSLCYWDFYFTLLVVIAAVQDQARQVLAVSPPQVPLSRVVGRSALAAPTRPLPIGWRRRQA